jgi:hypothetical protein
MFRSNRMLIAAAAVATGLVCASPAMAAITEIGPTGDAAPGTPACPDNCIAVTRTTGYQLSTAAAKDVMVIPKDGRIVAWTISLGSPSTKPTKDPDTGKKGKSQVQFFNDNYGGQASAGIAILTTGIKKRARTIALSPIITLTPYFGKTTQFALEQSIAVKKGDLVALNVPTWAPALAVGLDNNFVWRASRTENCSDPSVNQLQTSQTLNQLTQYNCAYKTARLTYSATLIPDPTPKPTSTGTTTSTTTPAGTTAG